MQRKKENLEKVRDLSQAIRMQNLAARSSSPTRQQPQQEQKRSSARERAHNYARWDTVFSALGLPLIN